MDLMAPWVSNSGLAPQSFCSILLLVLSLSLVFLCMRILRIRETEKYVRDHTAYKRQGSFWTQLCLTPKHIFCTTPFCPLLRYYVQEINIFCPISLPKLKSWHSPAQLCSHSHLLHQSRPIWPLAVMPFLWSIRHLFIFLLQASDHMPLPRSVLLTLSVLLHFPSVSLL